MQMVNSMELENSNLMGFRQLENLIMVICMELLRKKVLLIAYQESTKMARFTVTGVQVVMGMSVMVSGRMAISMGTE